MAEFKLTFEDGSDGYLAHHGVKGMKWGVWNEETRTRYGLNGGTLKKGTTVSRVAVSKKDPAYFNKKHVSTNKTDHEKWVEYLGPQYRDRGMNTYDIMYKTTNDLKVASSADLGRIYTEKILQNGEFSKRAASDTNQVLDSMHGSIKKTMASDVASGHLALQTKTGKRIVDSLLEEGYGAVADEHGRNTSDDPLIILNPDKNLKKVSVSKSKYWRAGGVDWAPSERKTYYD